MSHTPGPWHWDSDEVKGDPYGRVRFRVTTTGKTITQVYYSSYEGGLTNAVDDARLIAAAPDLLAALERLWNASEGRSDEEINARLHARAAIAKATGAA